jgi:hypothetical protein
VADYFFDLVLSLDDTNDNYILNIDWRENESKLWLNLPGTIKLIRDQGHQFNVQIKDLQPCLRAHPAFEDSNITHRFRGSTTSNIQKAWIFDTREITPDEF